MLVDDAPDMPDLIKRNDHRYQNSEVSMDIRAYYSSYLVVKYVREVDKYSYATPPKVWIWFLYRRVNQFITSYIKQANIKRHRSDHFRHFPIAGVLFRFFGNIITVGKKVFASEKANSLSTRSF